MIRRMNGIYGMEVVKLFETAISEIHSLALYCTFRNYRSSFRMQSHLACNHEFFQRERKTEMGHKGLSCINLVLRSTEILTTAERENPIARKVEKPQFFVFEWCFPLRVMEHCVTFRAHPLTGERVLLSNGIGRSRFLILAIAVVHIMPIYQKSVLNVK